MRKIGYIVLFTISSYLNGLGQQIKVIDATTLQPVPHVGIFNLDRSTFVQTNDSGNADLSKFSENDILEFQHPSYKNLVFPLAEVLKTGTVKLTEEIVRIDEVIISANKWKQSSGEVPNSIVSITPRDIKFNNPQTSADMLGGTGLIFVQKSQLGGGSPMIRGFAANSVLIAVDGVRMNNAIFRSGNLQNVINIDPNIIESAEVILGPGSVIYGSDAMGGVMNFNVRDPLFTSNDSPSHLVTGEGLFRYSSANKEKTGHINFNVQGRKISWLSSFTYSDFNDLKTGNKRTDKFPDYGKRTEYVVRINGQDQIINNEDVNRQVFSGYQAFSTIQKLKFRPTDFYDFTYNFYLSNTSDIPRYDRLIEYDQGQPRSAEWYYGPQKWMMNTVDFSYFRPTGIFDKMKTVFGNQQFQESRHDRAFENNQLRNREESVSVWTLNIDFEKDLKGDDQLFYGFEMVTNKVESSANAMDIETLTSGPASTRYPDGGSEMNSYATYFSYKKNIGARNILSVGLRYSYNYLNSVFEDTTFYKFPFNDITLENGAFTGNIGYVYKSETHWEVDLLASSGFRSPNVDDMGKVFDSEPGNVVVPNESLRPEYVYNAEVTIRKTVTGILSLGVTGFYTRLVDAMERRDFNLNGQDSIIYDGTLSKVEALTNIGKARIFGGSALLKIDFANNLFLTSSFTIMDGLDTDENIPLRHSTPNFGQTNLIFQGSKIRVDLFQRYQGAKSFDDLAPSEQNKTALYTTDGSLAWTTTNLKASWQPNSYLQINAGIENIFNIHYRPFSSGISAPGRNWIISLRGSF